MLSPKCPLLKRPVADSERTVRILQHSRDLLLHTAITINRAESLHANPDAIELSDEEAPIFRRQDINAIQGHAVGGGGLLKKLSLCRRHIHPALPQERKDRFQHAQRGFVR